MRSPEASSSQHENELLAAMRNTIERHRMFTPGDHVVVAVSGGADSVALLHALRELAPELGLRLTVAHLNHGIRGDTARREADFVSNLAEALTVPCVCEKRNVHTDKAASGECLQAAARTVRYRFLFDVLARCNAQKLALGHTMDDQAETVLIRLLRGASTRGLGGIPPMRDATIVRPLINIRRAAIERFLKKRAVAFVPDTSAHEPQYLRNKIRHTLLPLLEQDYNPRIVETLCTTADLARDDEALLHDAASSIAREALQFKDGAIHIPVSLLESRPGMAGRIVRCALELLNGSCRGLTSLHTEAVVGLLKSTGSSKQVPLKGGLIVRREYDELVMGHACRPTDFHIQIDSLPADIRLPETNLRIRMRATTVADSAHTQNTTDTVHLAAGSISLPIIIRSWKPGDRIRPFGFNAEKKVKAVFAENKIPVRLRMQIPMIESGGRIASVGTLRISEHCRVVPPCRDVIAVTITAADGQ